MGAELDISPPPPEPTNSREPEISGKDDSRNQNWKADMMSALGESVSFGRFLTEPLEWGKWSAFAHNRYLEEAAVQARPGTVAQNKAFFEACYYARNKKRTSDDDVVECDNGDRWEDGGVVDCGGSSSASVKPPEELADITDAAVGPCCRMDDEMWHMAEGSDDQAVVGGVLQLRKQDLCSIDSFTAVDDATLKDITDYSVKRRRIQMTSQLLSKTAKLSSPHTIAKKGKSSSAKRRSMWHSAKENTSPPTPTTDSSKKLGTTSTPKKRSTLSALHMSSMDSRKNLGTTIADRIIQLQYATRPAESTKPQNLRLSRKTFSSALPEIAPRTSSQVDQERSSHIMKIKEKLFGSTSPTVHQKSGITKEKEGQIDWHA